MSTTLHTLLTNLLAGGPLSSTQQDVLVDALACFDDDQADALLRKLTETTPPAEWTDKTIGALRTSAGPYRRLDAWNKAAVRCTPQDWEEAARTENFVLARKRLLEVAPATASRAGIESLVDVTTLENDFNYTLSEMASDLLRSLPDRLGWAAPELLAHIDRTINTDCIPFMLTLDLPADVVRAAQSNERLAPIHRVVLAANPTAPAGLVRPALEQLAQAGAEEVNTYWVRSALTQSFHALLDVPLGRADDRDAIVEFMPGTGGTLADVLVDVSIAWREYEQQDVERLAVDILALNATRQVGLERRAEMLWDLLPDHARTNRVCVEMVKKSSRAARAAIVHLGDNAYQVLFDADLISTPVHREPAARWLRDLAPDVWLAEMRVHPQTALITEQLTLWPENVGDDIAAVLEENRAARESVAADLSAHPQTWRKAAALSAFEALDPADIVNLPIEVVATAAAEGNGNAREALWSTLAAVSQSPCTSSTAERYLAVRSLVDGNVAVQDLTQAVHV